LDAAGRLLTSLDAMRQEDIWDQEAAQAYDTPGTGMFAPEVLGPAVDRLAGLAGDGQALEFAIGTGRVAIPLAPGTYTLVYLVFNTISNLLTQGEQVACFRNAARHLAQGGRFVIELWVPELRRLPPGQQAIVFTSEPGYIALDTYDVLRQHAVSHHFRFGAGKQARLFRSPHRYIWPSELDLMAQLAGFELEARHADWAGAEFTAESPSHVSVYRLKTA
jgi:SAM-dependent methyltransferase